MSTTATDTASPPGIAIIGSGFAGITLACYLKQAGIENIALFEKAATLGGVWRENTYPGAACDIPSHLYSLSFESRYPWAYRYGKQGEIVDYMRHIVRKYGIEAHQCFGREVTSAEFDQARGLWTLHFTDGSIAEARVLVSAVGQLHRPAYPDIPGREQFNRPAFHSAHWNHHYDFSGKTVAVIGSGASAVQFVPEIAPQVKQLYLYQRSPGWCIPKVDRRYSDFEKNLLRRLPFLYDLDRQRIFWMMETIAAAMLSQSAAGKAILAIMQAYAGLHLRRQVRNPGLRRQLTPDYPLGCKRTLLSNDWYPALVRPNVEVITDRTAAITATGVRSADGRIREVDAIVYGTGFAATEFLAPMEIKGLGGRSLRELWRTTPQAYLGTSVAGFPNFHVMYGPNTNLGAGSIIYMLEQQAQYITQSVRLMQQRSLRYLDVRADVQRVYNEELQQRVRNTTYETGCHSWYLNADGHNVNNWIGYMREYGQRLHTLNPDDFELVSAARVAPGS